MTNGRSDLAGCGAAAFFMASLLVACGDDGGVTNPPPTTVATIEISPSNGILTAIGATQQFSAVAKDADGDSVPDITFTWSVSDTSVVQVSPSGLVTARSFGTAWVTTEADAASDSAQVEVVLSLLPEDWSIPLDQQVQFAVRGPVDGQIEWSVEGVPGGNGAVGTIDVNGLYTAPASIPAQNPVMVRAVLLTSPAAAAASPVTVQSGQHYSGYRWNVWNPRVAVPGSSDSLTLEVGFATSQYPSQLELERPDGTRVHPSAIRTGLYAFRFSVAEVLTDHHAGHLNTYVGALRLSPTDGGYEQIRLNVMDATVPATSVTSIDDDIQAASHVVNIRYDGLFSEMPSDSVAQARRTVLQKFYTHFPDDFDLVVLIEQVNTSAPTYQRVRNDIAGLGLEMFDECCSVGHRGRLQGLVWYGRSTQFDLGSRLFLEFLGSRWMVYLGNTVPIFGDGWGGWPLSSAARGIMGYFNRTLPCEVRHVSDDVYEFDCSSGIADEFNDLELYLMGLLPPDSVSTHVVFDDQSMDVVDGARGTADTVSIQQIIAAAGARDPDYAGSPKDFTVATIVLSKDRLLSAAEMAYFNHMARRGEARVLLPIAEKPFYLATGGRATLTARVLP